ncbi:MAG: hypothetical protein AB7U73_00570 [Pirellulales bacterium]
MSRRKSASGPSLELEQRCEFCGGRGRDAYTSHRCFECGGSGYISTKFGKKVVELMRHHFATMLENAQA